MGKYERSSGSPEVPKPEYKIYGRGEIGDKSRQLIDKQEDLHAVGFRTPQRVILAENFFDGFISTIDSRVRTIREAEEVPDIVEKAKNADITQTENDLLAGIRREFGRANPSAPLMVRSSAKGDARGTGIYASFTKPNTQEGVIAGVKGVVASYFSDDAVAFRRDADTGKGLGVIIEPMVGQPVQIVDAWTNKKENLFAPILSGIAYTSTTRGEGYITVIPGFGGGVDRRGAERLTRSIVEHKEESPNNKIVRNYKSIWGNEITDENRGEGLQDFVADTAALVPVPNREYFLTQGRIVLPDKVNNALHPDIFLQLFDKLDALQERVGKPQYLEWAMTMDGTTPTFWAVQVADVDKKVDVFEASERYSTTMFTAGEVTGSGAVDAEKIVVCRNSEQIQNLERFNAENEGYVLVYFEDLTANNIFVTGPRLRYSHLSNAKVILELPGGMGHYAALPIAHFGGMIESTKKIFGVLGEKTTHVDDWSEFYTGSKREDGLEVYDGKIKVVADEKKNKLEVTVDPKPRPKYDDPEFDFDTES